MRCPACDHLNPDRAKFCSECGGRLPVGCSTCGAALPEIARFCLECGAAVGAVSESPRVAPLPASFANGRYTVSRFLGEGGKKKVYLVHDTSLDRDVAFSLIKTDGLDETGVERIRREARVMGRLGGHPHIVSVFDMGEEAGQPFLVSELMAGGDVEGLIASAPEHRPPPSDTLRIADQVCQALTYAHEHGIIHRDLKPGNVWLTKDGTAKLGDFGLAMAIDKTRLSIAGMIVGTVGYMPPEQAMGRAPDARSDLYSLGAMLYELTTGRPPFLGDDPVSVISQHIHTAPVAPRWHVPQLPTALEALILRLLAKDPAERPASAEHVRQELAVIAATEAARTTPSTGEHALPAQGNPLDRLAGGVFVGRERELADLRAGLDRTLSGQREVLLLVGEPGIGKTRLAEELATYAGLRGAQVLWGRSYEWEGAPTYWPWVQMLRDYVHQRELQALRSDLGVAAPHIAQIVSDIRERLPDIPVPGQMGAEEARFQLFDGIVTFLKNALIHQPLLLIVDDLHWADKPSLLLLEFLARELGNARVLLVGTYRDVEVGRQHPLSQTLAELSRARLSRRILLRGLSRDDVGHFITLASGATARQELVVAVERETEGNPFFVTEVVRLLVSEGRLDRPSDSGSWSVTIPESVREVVGTRLSRLSEPCNRVLTVASVIGREFRLATLERVLGLLADQILDLLEEAIRGRLVEELDVLGHYGFSHALVRETLYEELSTARRVRLHRQVGEAIEALQATNLARYLEELAHHFFEAAAGGDTDKAIGYLVQAGDAALELLGYEEAIGHYERALQLLDLRSGEDDERRCEVLLGLGDAQARSGTYGISESTFLRAAELARAAGRTDLLTRAVLVSEAAALFPFAPDISWVSLLHAALDGMAVDDSAARVRLMARLAVVLNVDPTAREQRYALSDEAVTMARRLNDPSTLAYALLARQAAQWTLKNLDQRLADQEEAIRLTHEIEDWQLALWATDWQFMNLVEAGRLDEAKRELQVNAALAERLRQPVDIFGARLRRSALAMLRGDLSESERLFETSELPTNPTSQAEMTGLAFRLRLEQGRLDELERALTELAVGRFFPAFFESALVLALACQGRRAQALSVLDRLVEDDLSTLEEGHRALLGSLAVLAEATWTLEDPAHASRLYERLTPFPDRSPYSIGGVFGSVSRYLGLLATTLDHWEIAERHFADAVAMNERLGARPFAAHSRHEWADMLVRRGDPGDFDRALALNAQALAAADEIGMTRLSEQALALKVRLQGILNA